MISSIHVWPNHFQDHPQKMDKKHVHNKMLFFFFVRIYKFYFYMPAFIILVTTLVYILRRLYTSEHFTAYPTAIWVIKVDPFRMQA